MNQRSLKPASCEGGKVRQRVAHPSYLSNTRERERWLGGDRACQLVASVLGRLVACPAAHPLK